MLVEKMSLEDAGWKPYWDSAGRVPVQDGDKFEVVPNGTVDIFYTQRPVQEEDGKWYVNDLYLYDPAPYLIGGLYTKHRMKTLTRIAGNGEPAMSIDGKIEEVSIWGAAIDKASMVNYQTNLTGMIGSGIEYMYQDEQEAADSMLYHYFKTDSIVPVAKNYDDGDSIMIKNGFFEIGSGKISNAVSLYGDDAYMDIENTIIEKNFSINIRFYMETLKDFVLIDNNDFILISFNETTGKFAVKLKPYIGNSKTEYLEIPNLKIHHWYDMGIIYSDGVMSIVVDGETIEEFPYMIGIGGVNKIKLDMSNIASIDIYGKANGMLVRGNTNRASNWYGVDADSSTNIIANLYRNKEEHFDSGAKNAVDLFCDRDNLGPSAYINAHQATSSVLDEISGTVKIVSKNEMLLGRYQYEYRYISAEADLYENIDGSFYIHYLSSVRVSGDGGYAYDTYNGSAYHNKLMGMTTLRLRITFKDTITSSEQSFPMITTFPGTRMKVRKRSIEPDYEIIEKFKSNSAWGRYRTNSTVYSYPALRNIESYYIVVRRWSDGEYAYVPPGYICYDNGGLVVTSYDSRYRYLVVEPNKEWEISVINRQS